MQGPGVVGSKLAPPRVPNVVARPRVLEALQPRESGRVTWLAARAGAGKSVALAQLAAQSRTAVWLRLDAGDADVASFFGSLSAAVRTTWPRRKLNLPEVRPGHLASVETFAARFAQAAFGRGKPPVILLDDYHRLGASADLDRALVALVTALDEGRVIVASRTPPPPAFARLRVSGAMHLLDAEVLDFTLDEASDACAARGRASADPGAILRSTQGWATAVALLAGRSGASPEGTPELIFDYLAAEVFEHLDARSQEVLLATTFLPTIDAPLASKLTEHNPTPVLEALAREASFTRRESDGVFRHHDLFREFLQARVVATEPDEGKGRMLATAKVLSRNDPAAAGALLVRARAWKELSTHVLSHGMALAQTGRFHTLAGWVEALPAEIVDERPWLSYWLGAALLATHPTDSHRALRRAFDGFAEQKDPIGYALAFSLFVTAVTAERHDCSVLDGPLARLFQGLDEDWPPLDPFVEAHLASGIAIALCLRDPNHPRLVHWQDRALALMAYLPLPEPKAIALGRASLTAIWTGDFARAAAILEPMEQLAKTDERSPFLVGVVHLTLTYHALYTSPRDCEKWSEIGTAAEEANGSVLWTHNLRCHAVAALLSLGRLDEADAALASMAASVHESTRLEQGYYAELRAWSALARGRYGVAIRFAEQSHGFGIAYGACLPCWSAQYAMALASIGMGDVQRASDLLDELDREAASMRFFPFMVGFARARIALEAGDEDAAATHLAAALEVSAQLSCMNFFYWCNDQVAPLLLLALRRQLLPEHVRQLILHHGVRVDVPPELVFAWPHEVEIHALGPLEVRVGGADPSPLTGIRAALLAELITTPRGATQERLCDLLWPDADGDQAVQSLHTTLHRLRQVLGRDSIVHDGTRLRVDPRTCLVDAWVLLDRADDADVRGALRERVRGDALQDLRLTPSTRAWKQRVDAALSEL